MVASMSAHVIHSARLVSGVRITRNAWVRFDRDVVGAVGTGDDWRISVAGDEPDAVTDVDGAWLTPGFVDIHVHGGGGASFDDGAEAIRTAMDLHRRHGTTRFVL